MGDDYQPIVVFGLKLDKSQIMETVKTTVNECICDQPKVYPNAKFCPKCGKNVSRTIIENIPKFEGFEDPENNDLEIVGWPAIIEVESCNFYVGFYVKKGVYGNYGEIKHDFPDMLNMDPFITDMKDLGLWNEEMFGAWVILDFSC